MAEEQKKDEDFGKKCAHSGVPLKKGRRYYRNGQYYRNKAAFQAKMKKEQSEAKAAAAEAAEAVPEQPAQPVEAEATKE